MTPRPRPLTAALVLLTLALLAPRPAPAQPLADRIPQDALLYAGWTGAQHMPEGYNGSHLKAVLGASQFKALLEESLPRLLENMGHQDQDAAQVTSLIATLGAPAWRHPTALYFGGIDLANPEVPMPKLGLLCDAGADGKKLAADVQALVAKFQGFPVPVKVEEQDGLVSVVLGTAELSAKKKPAIPLSQRKEFQQTKTRLGAESPAVGMIWVDTEGAIEQLEAALTRFQPDAKAKWLTVKQGLGLGGLKRLAWVGSFDKKDWSSRFVIEAPAPRTGLLAALLADKPVSDASLRAIPSTATIALATHFQLGGMLGAARETVAQIDKNAGDEFAAALDSIKQALGLDLETDILNTLGDEWVLFSDPSIGGQGLLGMTVVNRLADPAKAEKALTQLTQLANGALKQATGDAPVQVTFQTAKQGDLTIQYLAVPVVAPGWAIKDGVLYIALYPQVIAGAAEHAAAAKAGGKAKSLLDNEDFVALRKRLGGEKASYIVYTDLPSTTADGYQEILMLTRAWLGTADLFGARTPAMALPPLAKLLPEVTPGLGAAWADDAGYHYRTLSPFPGSDVLAVGGYGTLFTTYQAASVGVLLPALNQSRMMAGRVRSASNLRQIGQGMLLYANENKGKYPGTLGEIFLTQDVTAEVFLNPEAGTKLPNLTEREKIAAWINENSDYVYLGAGKKFDSPPETILAHEKIRPNAPGVNLLYGDGHVEYHVTFSAQQLIARQKQKDKANPAPAGAPKQ